jgi:hypothetical protein
LFVMPYYTDTYFYGCATEVIEALQEEEEVELDARRGTTTTNDGTTNDGTTNDGTTNDGTTNDGSTTRAIPPGVRRIERIGVNLSEPGSILWFPRLVDAIEQQGGSRVVQLDLVRGHFSLDGAVEDFDDDGNLVAFRGDRLCDHRDLERFFGTVLPRHPSLKDLMFTCCRIDRHFLRLLTEPMATAISTPMPLTDLCFFMTPIDSECAQLIKRMLQTGPLAKLVITFCRIDADICRCICEGATGRTKLRYLSFKEIYHDGRLAIQSDTLAAALGPASKLTGFDVRASSWTDEAVEKAVAALRTNAELQHVRFVSFDPQDLIRHAALFEDLLHRYNFTLVDLLLPDGADQEPLLLRNERIRALHGGLRDRGYCVPHSAALWPNVLERIGTFPTLLYRFVRRGNTTALAEQ